MKHHRLWCAICFALLAGCNSADWRDAPYRHECTEDEIRRVHEETLFCAENTGYLNSYCYGSAIVRNCDQIGRSDR